MHEGCLDIKPGIMYAGELHSFMAKKYVDSILYRSGSDSMVTCWHATKDYIDFADAGICWRLGLAILGVFGFSFKDG